MFSAAKSMAGGMCIKVVGSSQKVCCPIHQAITSWKKTFHSIAGGKRGKSCRCSGCAVCCVCSVLRCLVPSCRLRRLAKWCEMVWDGARWCRQAAADKQQQASSSRQAAGKQQASRQASRQASSKQASQPASQPASSSSKQQQQAAAAASSRQAAASKQQPAFAPLKEWTNIIKL